MVEGFQRSGLKCEKLTDDRRRTPSDGKSSHCLWQGELKRPQHIMSEIQLLAMRHAEKGERVKPVNRIGNYINP